MEFPIDFLYFYYPGLLYLTMEQISSDDDE